MKRSKRAMRLVILSSIFKHLKAVYHLDWPRREFGSGQITDYELSALLAFKSDPWLNELRDALERLENQEYGICIGCGEEIEQRLLDEYPARRLCRNCENSFSRRLTHESVGSVAAPAPVREG